MATTKITVTIPEELAAYIREQVSSGRYDSVSAYIARAADSLRSFDPLDLVITSMVAETGVPDAATNARLDEVEAAARRAREAAGTMADDAA